jgi:hypothetical protein
MDGFWTWIDLLGFLYCNWRKCKSANSSGPSIFWVTLIFQNPPIFFISPSIFFSSPCPRSSPIRTRAGLCPRPSALPHTFLNCFQMCLLISLLTVIKSMWSSGFFFPNFFDGDEVVLTIGLDINKIWKKKNLNILIFFGYPMWTMYRKLMT